MSHWTSEELRNAVLTGAVLATSLFAITLMRKRLREAKYEIHVLKNNGLEVHVSTLGAIIHKLLVPDAGGDDIDVALGHSKLSEYTTSGTYFGSVCGRSANRIEGGKFTIGAQQYQLTQNNDGNHLHGGFEGWDKKIWKAVKVQHPDGPAIKFTHISPDGDEGYPGTVTASVTYILQFNKTLRAVFEATTTKETPINIVQHCYFNLGGHNSGNVLNHTLQINASHYTPKDKGNAGVIPTGEIVPVKGTPFDFSSGKLIGKDYDQLQGGYDHNFVLFGKGSGVRDTRLSRAKENPEFAALLESSETGISMQVSTTAPGLQVYTGGFLADVAGKDGATYQAGDGICLETQGFPNAVNESRFPSGLVRPGEKYYHEVLYQFRCK